MVLASIKSLYARLLPVLQARQENVGRGYYAGILSGEIEIGGLSFRYHPDHPLALDEISLHISPGEFVAFVGPSGAGKSSLVRLLLCFDEPQAGSIFYDGKDLARLDKQTLRRNFGVVLQNSIIISGSIYDNIAGGGQLSMDDAWHAAAMAGLDEDIKAMPMGMYNVLIEGAATLSGGQRQRLLIARALANKPSVLIFNEATSALDNKTQAIVSHSIESLNCTRITIAHRLSTIVNADRIYVMDRGRIIERGSYAELMAQQGKFAEHAARQLA